MPAVSEHERRLTAYAQQTLQDAFGDDIRIHGPADPAARGGVMSFAFRDLHPHDVSQILDQHNVCVRAGHHCAKPLMRELGVVPRRGQLVRLQRRSRHRRFVTALDSAADIFGLSGPL